MNGNKINELGLERSIERLRIKNSPTGQQMPSIQNTPIRHIKRPSSK